MFCLCLWMYVHIIIIPLYSFFFGGGVGGGGCPLSSDDFQSWISSVLLYTFMWSLERIFYWNFHPSPVPTFEVHCLVCYFFFIFVPGVVRHLWAFLRVQIHVSLSTLYTRVCLHMLGRCFQSSLLSAMSFGWCLWFVFLPLCMLFTLDHAAGGSFICISYCVWVTSCLSGTLCSLSSVILFRPFYHFSQFPLAWDVFFVILFGFWCVLFCFSFRDLQVDLNILLPISQCC